MRDICFAECRLMKIYFQFVCTCDVEPLQSVGWVIPFWYTLTIFDCFNFNLIYILIRLDYVQYGWLFLCESHSSEKFYTLILLSTAYLHVKIPPAIIYAGQKNETNHNMLVKSAWAKPYIHQLNHSFVLFKKHLTVQMQTIIVSATFNVPFKSTLSWLFDDGQKVLSIHCSAERVTNCGGRERANWNQA